MYIYVYRLLGLTVQELKEYPKEIQNVFLARHSCPANIHAKSKCTPAYSTPAPAVA